MFVAFRCRRLPRLLSNSVREEGRQSCDEDNERGRQSNSKRFLAILVEEAFRMVYRGYPEGYSAPEAVARSVDRVEALVVERRRADGLGSIRKPDIRAGCRRSLSRGAARGGSICNSRSLDHRRTAGEAAWV